MPQSSTALSVRPAIASATAPRLVSVVMPTFNAALTVRRALASVRAQTHTEWEAICVDDASTDDTVAHIATFDDPRGEVTGRVGLVESGQPTSVDQPPPVPTKPKLQVS